MQTQDVIGLTSYPFKMHLTFIKNEERRTLQYTGYKPKNARTGRYNLCFTQQLFHVINRSVGSYRMAISLKNLGR